MKYDFEMTVDEQSSVGKIVRQIKENSTVLEFGPGNGRMTNYLITEKKCQVSIVEFDEELYNFVMQFATDGFLGNIEEYKWVEYFKNTSFDYIVFADVLEHLVDPIMALKAAKTVLNPDGQILISFPNLAHNSALIGLFNNQLEWKEFGLLDHTHNTFYTQAGFEKVFQSLDLHIAIEEFTYSQVGQNEIQTAYEDLPEKIRYAFKMRPFGEVYQYFYALTKSPVEMPKRMQPINSHFVKQVQLVFTLDGKQEIHPLLYNQETKENQFSTHDIAANVNELKIVPFEGNGVMEFYAEIEGKMIRPSKTNAVWVNGKTYVFTGIDENPYFVFTHDQIAGKTLSLYFNLVDQNSFSSLETQVLDYAHQQESVIERLKETHAKELLALENEKEELLTKTAQVLSRTSVKQGSEKWRMAELKHYHLYQDSLFPDVKLMVETIENDPDRNVAIIKGWGFAVAQQTPLIYQVPLFEGLVSLVSPIYRKDVNEMFGLPEKEKYGFMIEIEQKQIEKVVGLLVSIPDTTTQYAFKFQRHNLDNTPWAKKARYLLGAVRQQGLRNVLRNRKLRLEQADQYDKWIKENEQYDVAKVKQEIKRFGMTPKISLVVPVYNVEEKWLRACIDSLKNQYYDNWELCLADDASPKAEIRPLIERYVHEDARIKAVFREQNGHISEATNSAIELATGEYIGFMDNDDELAPQALYEVVKAINEDNEYEFIYTDEDKLNLAGKRFDPFFKPNWNPTLLLGHNYITHFVVVKRNILDKIGGLRSEFNGSQDYDFVLRATQAAKKVHHIPVICYHWRTVETSVAFDPKSKEYAYVAGQRAIEEHLSQRDIPAKVTMTKHYGAYKVDYLYQEEPLVSIIALGEYARVSLWIEDLLQNTYYSNIQLLVPKKFQQAFPTSDKRVSFVEGQAPFDLLEQANGEYIVCLNEWLTPKNADWLKELLNPLRQETVGAVTGKIVQKDERVLNVGVSLRQPRVLFDDQGATKESIGYYFRSVLPREIYLATMDSLAIRKSDLETLDYKHLLTQQPTATLFGPEVYTTLHQKFVFTPYSLFEYIGEKPEESYRLAWEDTFKTLHDPYQNPNALN